MKKIIIAGVNSGAGKTTITLGLLRALKNRNITVQPFKCGPDYIDTEYHKEASNVISRNLDTWMMGKDGVKYSFNSAMQNADFAVIEGVMGLFDGASSDSLEGSTAHIAKILNIPILLVVNAKAIARSIAPLVKGFVDFEKGVNVVGVIANNVGSLNHANILKEALLSSNLPPLVGFLPKNNLLSLPERHLGLVPETENKKTNQWYNGLAKEIENNFDLDKIIDIATDEKTLPFIRKTIDNSPVQSSKKLGLAFDEAFHFYYEDNLDMLKNAGFEIIKFSPMNDKHLPENLDILYIGGGYPEVFAEQLTKNDTMMQDIANFANDNNPIYAECGGLMYLSKSITNHNGNKYQMCGVLPINTQMETKLYRLGYTTVTTTVNSILGPIGTSYRGHEFHWSSIIEKNFNLECCEVRKNRNKTQVKKTGIHIKNVYASYIHAHFASNPTIIKNIFDFLF